MIKGMCTWTVFKINIIHLSIKIRIGMTCLTENYRQSSKNNIIWTEDLNRFHDTWPIINRRVGNDPQVTCMQL